MISALKSIFSAIVNFFDLVVSLVEFIFSLVEDLIKVVGLLVQSLVNLPSFLNAFLPTAFVSVCMVILSIVVIYKVMGREG